MLLTYLDLSTAHLTQKTLNSLNESCSPYSYQYDNGVFISVPDNDDPEEFAKYPKDLRILLKYAWKKNAKLIRLDADAPIEKDLPTYAWD